MRVFLTGAAGPLGRALTELLRSRGDTVIGQVRRPSGLAVLEALGAEPVTSDLTRPRLLADAMSGCDLVIHVAQFFDFWAPQPVTFRTVNVHGAENTLAAALEVRVPRVVFVSSSLTIGEPPDSWGTERTVHRGYTLTAFERSKLAAEHLTHRYRLKGIDVVTVNPGIVVAPDDPGWLGRLVTDYLAGRRRRAPEAPLGWISAGDAAAGIVLAAERGRSGARYILNAETVSLREFMTRVMTLSGEPPPGRLTRPLAMATATLGSAAARVVGRRPRLSLDEARLATTGFRVDGSYAARVLGVRYTPMAEYLPSIVASYRRAMSHPAA
jgi:dihydroflavonol-4-reductase